MNKQEAIEQLESVVAEHDYQNGLKIAGELEDTINMEPTGWIEAQDAIIWQGFRIYRNYHSFSSSFSLATDVVFTREYGSIFGKKTETWQGWKYIDSPRHMLNILKYETPWEEK